MNTTTQTATGMPPGMTENKMNTLRQVFEDSLKGIYWSEKALTEALPEMISNASNDMLKEGLSMHLEETHGQVERLERIFESMGTQPQAKECMAMAAMLKEGKMMVQSAAPGPIRDTVIVEACRKVEHYEMASYEALMAVGEKLEQKGEVADLLKDTLHEEEAADKKLKKIAKSEIDKDEA